MIFNKDDITAHGVDIDIVMKKIKEMVADNLGRNPDFVYYTVLPVDTAEELLLDIRSTIKRLK